MYQSQSGKARSLILTRKCPKTSTFLINYGSTQESDPSPDSIEHLKCKGGYLADKESISNELNNFFVKQQIDLLFAQNIGKYIAASNYHKGTQFHHTKPQEMMASVQGCQRSQPVQKARK